MGNLFIGTVVNCFGRQKEKITNNSLLTVKEYQYLDLLTKCY